MANENFNPGLESLRGLAAFGVAWTHSNMVFAVLPSLVSYPLLASIRNWVFFVLPAGASVTLFFALSGYVLGLALIRDGSYVKFVTRRLFRIFPTLWVGVIVTFLAERLLAGSLPKEEFTEWYRNVFLLDPTWRDMLRNMVLRQVDVDPVIWSLAPEVVWSLALPAAAWIHFRADQLGRLALLACVVLVGHYSDRVTVQFAATFYAGFFVPREILAPRLKHPIAAIGAAIAGWAVLCIGNRYGVPYTTPMRESCMVGAVLLVSGVSAAPQAMRLLNLAPFRFLGRISYSFYLLHLPTLFLLSAAAIYFPAMRPQSTLDAVSFAAASIAVAVAAAALCQRYIEVPGIDLGRAVYDRLWTPLQNSEQALALVSGRWRRRGL